MVWAIGVVVMITLAALVGLYAMGTATQVAAGLATSFGAAARTEPVSATSAATEASVDYFVDALFRPASGTAVAGGGTPTPVGTATVGSAAAGAQPTLSSEARAEVARILARSVSQGRLDDDDRAYLAQLVSARTGLPPD